MQQEAASSFPALTASVGQWEACLRQHLQRKSSLRVRTSHLGESPGLREQLFLKRLKTSAQRHFQQSALAATVPALQRQVLDLIQMRRRLIPDDSPAWNQAEVFLAVAELHRCLNDLLAWIDSLQAHHQQVAQLLQQAMQLHQQLIRGALQETPQILTVLRQIRAAAADQSIIPALWLGLCGQCAEYESLLSQPLQRKALASSLQTTYLAMRILRTEHWLLETDAILLASLFKDAGALLSGSAENQLFSGHHAEWSAGLILQAVPQSATVPRLIRQHHECLDGTGLPFGMNATQLRRDARLLALLTRWSELYLDQQPALPPLTQLTSRALQSPCEILTSECRAGRWDASWLAALQNTLALSADEMPFAATFSPSRNANPHWHIPRPHFIKKSSPLPSATSQPAR